MILKMFLIMIFVAVGLSSLLAGIVNVGLATVKKHYDYLESNQDE